LRVFGSAPDGDNLVPKLARKLNPEVPQTANTLYRNQVTGKRSAMPQRVVSSNSGAEQWCRVNVI
jgi:hypothetical protein